MKSYFDNLDTLEAALDEAMATEREAAAKRLDVLRRLRQRVAACRVSVVTKPGDMTTPSGAVVRIAPNLEVA